MTSIRQKAIVHIGGSSSQLLSVRAERQSGLAVIVTDRDAEAAARTEADHFINFGATQTEEILSALKACSDQYDIVGAYGVADYAFCTVGAIHREFAPHLPQAGTYDNFTNKCRTNAALARHSVPQPHQIWSGSRCERPDADAILKNSGDKPLVVKSASLNNSNSVLLLDSPSEAQISQALDHVFARGDFALVEQKLTGRICNVDGFMARGKFFFISTTWRLDDIDMPQVCTAMIQPADLWPGFAREAAELARRAANALGYRDGPFTVDMIDGGPGEGQLKILEASPHFHLPQCDWLRGNGNPMAACASYFSGDHDWQRFLGVNSGFGACVQVSAKLSGRVTEILGVDTLESNSLIGHFSLNVRPGMLIPPSENKTPVALVWLTGNSTAEVLGAIEIVQSSILVRVDREVG